MGELLPQAPKEFHFVDIYNGFGNWKPFKEDKRNLRLIEAFGNIYSSYRWPVMVQTIDDRTLRDHGIQGFSDHSKYAHRAADVRFRGVLA